LEAAFFNVAVGGGIKLLFFALLVFTDFYINVLITNIFRNIIDKREKRDIKKKVPLIRSPSKNFV
jgi:hypothetical protein